MPGGWDIAFHACLRVGFMYLLPVSTTPFFPLLKQEGERIEWVFFDLGRDIVWICKHQYPSPDRGVPP